MCLAQVDFLKLLYDRMVQVHGQHVGTPHEWRFPRPSFKVPPRTPLVSDTHSCPVLLNFPPTLLQGPSPNPLVSGPQSCPVLLNLHPFHPVPALAGILKDFEGALLATNKQHLLSVSPGLLQLSKQQEVPLVHGAWSTGAPWCWGSGARQETCYASADRRSSLMDLVRQGSV